MASSSGLRPSTEDDDMFFVLESRLKDMREAVDTQGAALWVESDSPDPSEGARAIAELRRSLDGIKSSSRPSKLQERFSAAVSASSSPVVRLSAPKEAIPPEPRTGLSTPTPPVVSQYTDSAIAATVNRAAGLQPGEITASKIALVNRNAASRSLVLDSMRTTETLGSMIQRAVSPRTGPRTQPAPPAVVHSMPKPPSNLPVCPPDLDQSFEAMFGTPTLSKSSVVSSSPSSPRNSPITTALLRKQVVNKPLPDWAIKPAKAASPSTSSPVPSPALPTSEPFFGDPYSAQGLVPDGPSATPSSLSSPAKQPSKQSPRRTADFSEDSDGESAPTTLSKKAQSLLEKTLQPMGPAPPSPDSFDPLAMTVEVKTSQLLPEPQPARPSSLVGFPSGAPPTAHLLRSYGVGVPVPPQSYQPQPAVKQPPSPQPASQGYYGSSDLPPNPHPTSGPRVSNAASGQSSPIRSTQPHHRQEAVYFEEPTAPALLEPKPQPDLRGLPASAPLVRKESMHIAPHEEGTEDAPALTLTAPKTEDMEDEFLAMLEAKWRVMTGDE